MAKKPSAELAAFRAKKRTSLNLDKSVKTHGDIAVETKGPTKRYSTPVKKTGIKSMREIERERMERRRKQLMEERKKK